MSMKMQHESLQSTCEQQAKKINDMKAANSDLQSTIDMTAQTMSQIRLY